MLTRSCLTQHTVSFGQERFPAGTHLSCDDAIEGITRRRLIPGGLDRLTARVGSQSRIYSIVGYEWAEKRNESLYA